MVSSLSVLDKLINKPAIALAVEEIGNNLGIEEDICKKYLEEEIYLDESLVEVCYKRYENNKNWRVGFPLGGAGTILNAIILYCLVRHYRMSKIVETGVSGGLYTCFFLSALNKNKVQNSTLVSLELSSDTSQVAKLVPESFKKFDVDWQLRMGKPSLDYFINLDHSFDLYCHDSLHTMSYMLKELLEFRKSSSNNFIIFVDDQHSDNFWKKCIAMNIFPRSGYECKFFGGEEGTLLREVGGIVRYQKIEGIL